jgi:shikimate kinase
MGSDAVSSANAKSIWLIGLMGSGKSTIGRALAQSLHYEYVDNDTTIAAVTGHSIVELAESGGTLLHDWESSYVHQVVANRRPLVAGIPASIADRCAELQLLRGSGTLVYLRCDLDTLVARVRTDGSRPWLKHDVRQTIEAMLADREPRLLRVAHLVLDSSAPVAEIVDRIVTGIRN